jgi:hypothetical protein
VRRLAHGSGRGADLLAARVHPCPADGGRRRRSWSGAGRAGWGAGTRRPRRRRPRIEHRDKHASANAMRAVPGPRARSSPGSAAGTVGGPAARDSFSTAFVLDDMDISQGYTTGLTGMGSTGMGRCATAPRRARGQRRPQRRGRGGHGYRRCAALPSCAPGASSQQQSRSRAQPRPPRRARIRWFRGSRAWARCLHSPGRSPRRPLTTFRWPADRRGLPGRGRQELCGPAGGGRGGVAVGRVGYIAAA